MKISEVELGTVIDVPSQSITGAVLVAKASGSPAGLNYLLGRVGKKTTRFWAMSDKLWFDRIVHSFVPPAQLPLRYDWGYWVEADTEVKIASSIPTAELSLSINDLPLGSIVDTDYAGKIIKATIIARAGAFGCPDALLGWEEEPTCDTATKSLTRKTTIQAPRSYSSYTYLQDHQHIIDKYPKSIWVTGTSKVSKVYDPPKPKQAPAKDLSLGDVIDAEYYGLIKHGTIIGKQKSSGNVLIGWPKDESKNSTAKHISDTYYQYFDGSNQTYLIDDSKELARQYPNSVWITGKEQATLILTTLSKDLILKDIEHITQQLLNFNKDITKRTLSNSKEVAMSLFGLTDRLNALDDEDYQQVIPSIQKLTNILESETETLLKEAAKTVPANTTIDLHLEDVFTTQQVEELKQSIIKSIKEDKVQQSAKAAQSIISAQNKSQVIQNKDRIVAQRISKPSFADTLKADATNAVYRVASTQITHATKSLIVGMMQKAGSSSTSITALTQMLDSQMGEALIAYLMGMGLQQTSLVDDARIQKIAEECRILGMTSVGNQAFEMLMEVVMPVISQALQTLPQETTVRVATTKPISQETGLEAVEAIEEEAPKQLTV